MNARVETAAGRAKFVRRWGALAGTVYVPKTHYGAKDPRFYCLAEGARVWSSKHADYPDVFTMIVTDAAHLWRTLDAHGSEAPTGFKEFALQGTQLQDIALGTTTVLMDGPWGYGRLWLVRDWEADAPAELRPFGESFPTATVVDFAGFTATRYVLQRRGPDENSLFLGLSEYKGVEVVRLLDEVTGRGWQEEEEAGGRFSLAYPGDLLAARERGSHVVLQGDLLYEDPFSIWLVAPEAEVSS